MRRLNFLLNKQTKVASLLFELPSRKFKGTDSVSDFNEQAKVTSMSKTDSTLEEALKPQQGVLCMRNRDRGLVKTTNFAILVKCDRKAFNLDFVSVDNKPIKYWALDSKKATQVLENEKLSKDLSAIDLKNRNKANTESITALNSNLSVTSKSDILTLMKHPCAPAFLRKRGDVCKVIEANHPRITIGKCIGSGYDGKLIIKPFDRKLPKICVRKRSLSSIDTDLAHVVTIHAWPENSDYANGEILETFEISDLDYDFIVTKNLILNEIDIRNYSHEFENDVSRKIGINECDFVDRLDYRNETVFTIDPTDAMDLDDALSCKLLNDGNYEIGVHIADVSHFIKPGTELDDLARKRNTSVYLPQTYIPMLPLSLRRMCTLVPGKDRLTISLIFNVTEEGTVFKELYRLSVINSVNKFSYEEAEKVITSDVNEEIDQRPEYVALRLLHKLSQTLKTKRCQSNSFHLQKENPKFKVEKFNEELDITQTSEPRKQSEMLVEEMMILANSKVATSLLKQYPNCALLRVQPPMDNKFLLNLQMLSNESVYSLNTNNMQELQKSIVDILGDAKLHDRQIIADTFIHLMQKSNRRAKYVCSGINRNVPMFHSALNTTYTHLTSPMRRYADIVVHRLLKSSLQQEKSNDAAIDDYKVAMIAELCNSRKSAVLKVANISRRFLMKLYIAKHGPFTESCAVIAIHSNYFSVYVKRFSLVAKVYYTEIDGIKCFEVSTDNKKPGLYKGVLQFKDEKMTLEPLSVVTIMLRCNVNEEKQCFDLTVKLDNNMPLAL